MKIIIILIAIVFSFLAFGSNLPPAVNQNILNAYLIYALGIIGNNIFLFLIGFIVISFLILKSLRIERQHPQKNHLLIIATQACFVFITGVFLSFVVLLLIAILQLNFLAYVLDMSPNLLGIQTNIKEITSSLTKNARVPEIIASDPDHYKQLQAIASATTGTNSFYGKYMLPSIPDFLVLPTKKLNSTMLIDKTLIISGINTSDLEQISPIVGYLFIKNYFPDKPIKHFPKVIIMTDGEYVKFRQADFTKKLTDINKQLLDTEIQISSTSALIQDIKNNIAKAQDSIKQAYLQKNKTLNKCVADGTYNSAGIFIRKNSKEYCNNLVSNTDGIVIDADNNINAYTKELEKNNNLLKTYQLYDDFFKAQSKLTNSLETNIPHELGLYVPPNTLQIVIDTTSPHAIADYLETVVHEYYHYTSHAEGGKSLSSGFFEEGLTEYFARNTIKDSINTSTNMGYPIFIKIISQITKIIPESELADIYFNKDQKRLESALNRVYGDNFYKNSLVLFTTIQYSSDFKQLLKYGNLLMAKINGPMLKENDLYSSSSKL